MIISHNKAKVGDRIKITAASMTFGDYNNGDTGVVTMCEEDGFGTGVDVKWDVPRGDEYHEKNFRCRYVSWNEYEVITKE